MSDRESILTDLRTAFDGDDIIKMRYALRRAHDFISMNLAPPLKRGGHPQDEK